MGKLGAKIPLEVDMKVIEQPQNALYLVLPTPHEELSDEELNLVAGGASQYGCSFAWAWDR